MTVSESILGSFDKQLQDYAMERFKREGITIKPSHHVDRVNAGKLHVKEEGEGKLSGL